MTICEYCKNRKMSKEDYKNFKANIIATANAISDSVEYKGGMYYSVNELFTPGSNEEIKDLIINELKKLNIEFRDNNTLYRVVGKVETEVIEVIEVIENIVTIKDGLEIECLGESQKGYKILIGCKGSNENKQIMKLAIYNTDTRECVYKTGNNLRIDFNTIIRYAETICITIDKYIDNKYNLDLTLNKFFYDYNIRLLEQLQNEYFMNKVNKLREIENNKYNDMNAELENKLYSVADAKGLYILKGISNLYVLSLKDSNWNSRFYNKSTQNFFSNLIEKDDNKQELKKFIDSGEMCINYGSDGLSLYSSKDYNKILIDSIDYMSCNIS